MPEAAASSAGDARWRVLVTRPQADSGGLLRRLGASGLQALSVPVMDIVPVAGLRSPSECFDEVVFVSRNAVRHGAELLRESPCWNRARFAAAGAGTARALREAGFHEVIEPAEGAPAGGDGLLQHPALQPDRIRGHSVLIIRGAGGREALAAGLRKRGAEVQYLEVYRRAAVPKAAGALRALHLADADLVIIVTSVGGVEAAVRNRRRGGPRVAVPATLRRHLHASGEGRRRTRRAAPCNGGRARRRSGSRRRHARRDCHGRVRGRPAPACHGDAAMSVGLLVITHERIATAIIDAATSMLDGCPLKVEVLPAPRDCDPDELRREAGLRVQAIDQGDGVLVLTDIYGSTPSNVACSLVDGKRVLAVSGINLPMLVRVMNYPRLSLSELADKAVSGGRDGVFTCRSPEHD